MKKRKVAKKKLTLKQAYENTQKRAARDRRFFMTLFNEVTDRLGKIEAEQRTIARSVASIMADYIRHPLKIDGMNQAAFRTLVEAAARNHPEQFKDNFNGRLEAPDG